MKFHVLTLFPEMILNGLSNSITGRAMKNNSLQIEAVNIRDFTQDPHGKVDDYTYGGGAGMLIQAQPVYDAWKSVSNGKTRTVYVTPQGKPFTQAIAAELAGEEELIVLCGHYEGIDHRVLEEVVTDYISIGDYVLTGGELPAMVIIDAVSRLVPGVLHNDESAQTESFAGDLLEYPQFSRPEEWHGKAVPSVLLSGNHKEIEKWRLEQSIKLTKERRPDLYASYQQREKLMKELARKKRQNIHMMESLKSGSAGILLTEGQTAVIYEPDSKVCMINLTDASDMEVAVDAIPGDAIRVIHTWEALNEILLRKGFAVEAVCKNVCYTEKNTLPKYYKDKSRKDDIDMEITQWANQELALGHVPNRMLPVTDVDAIERYVRCGFYQSEECIWILQKNQ